LRCWPRTRWLPGGGLRPREALVIDPVWCIDVPSGSRLQWPERFRRWGTRAGCGWFRQRVRYRYTYSADFPVTQGAFQTTSGACSGCVAAFVTKLNPSGTALVYSTYLGASGGGAYANALAVDASAMRNRRQRQSRLPTTPGAFQTTNRAMPGGRNPFVTKLNRPVARWSTHVLGGHIYLGGDDATVWRDSVGMRTSPRNTPAISGYRGGVPNGENAGGASNAFVAKLTRPAGRWLFDILAGAGRIQFSLGSLSMVGDGALGCR